MITSKKIFKLVETFESILPYAQHRSSLNMGEEMISSRTYECGTIHCHAGWYYLAKKWDRKASNFGEEDILYTRGERLLSKDLGVEDSDILGDLLGEDISEIWGNDFGLRVFYDKIAFVSPDRPKGAETLQDIVDHWGEVGMRLMIEELYQEGELGWV